MYLWFIVSVIRSKRRLECCCSTRRAAG